MSKLSKEVAALQKRYEEALYYLAAHSRIPKRVWEYHFLHDPAEEKTISTGFYDPREHCSLCTKLEEIKKAE